MRSNIFQRQNFTGQICHHQTVNHKMIIIIIPDHRPTRCLVAAVKRSHRWKGTLLSWICFLCIGMTKNLGLNGGYYSAGLQQAHSTTPHEAPHSVGAHAPQSVPPSSVTAPPVSAVSAAPPPGLPHGLSSKSVSSVAQTCARPTHGHCLSQTTIVTLTLIRTFSECALQPLSAPDPNNHHAAKSETSEVH